MADCKFCGKPAGILRSSHKDCLNKHQEGREAIIADIVQTIDGNGNFIAMQDRINSISAESFLKKADLSELLITAWERSVDNFLDDNLLDHDEEAKLSIYKSQFNLDSHSLNRNGHLERTVKSGVIRDLAEGKLPSRVQLDIQPLINFQKGEQIIWAFPGVEYLEDKTKTKYVGRSAGVSVRIMKGVYYRTGAFQGNPIQYTERVSVGTGTLIITNKHIYFHSTSKSFRLPFSKIISFEPFSNGIGIMKDGANAKLQVFVTGDGWFTYNVIANIANLQ